MECLTHGLLHPYPVLHEKGGELVAQVGAVSSSSPALLLYLTAALRQLGAPNHRVACTPYPVLHEKAAEWFF